MSCRGAVSGGTADDQYKSYAEAALGERRRRGAKAPETMWSNVVMAAA
jgi:hypothetical protein